MNAKERFYAAMEYRKGDRLPAIHHGTPEINRELMDALQADTYDSLLEKLGTDFRLVEPLYTGPELKQHDDGTFDGLWGERYTYFNFGKGTYPEAVYLPFKDVQDVEELDKFRFPSPDWFDYSNVKTECERLKNYVVYTGGAGIMDFMNGIARCRGVEQVLLDVGTEDPVFIKLMEIRHRYYLERYEKVLAAADGGIDVLYIGEDYGNQNGLTISPKCFDKLFAPRLKEFIELAHKYGARAMMHCCGSCYDLIPRFIELGLDILEVVQVDAAKMDITRLHREFYKKIAFCGSISVQSTLPFGTAEDVVKEVELRKSLFAEGGIIIAATHDIQVGTPVENILAMYRAIGSMK